MAASRGRQCGALQHGRGRGLRCCKTDISCCQSVADRVQHVFKVSTLCVSGYKQQQPYIGGWACRLLRLSPQHLVSIVNSTKANALARSGRRCTPCLAPEACHSWCSMHLSLKQVSKPIMVHVCPSVGQPCISCPIPCPMCLYVWRTPAGSRGTKTALNNLCQAVWGR